MIDKASNRKASTLEDKKEEKQILKYLSNNSNRFSGPFEILMVIRQQVLGAGYIYTNNKKKWRV